MYVYCIARKVVFNISVWDMYTFAHCVINLYQLSIQTVLVVLTDNCICIRINNYSEYTPLECDGCVAMPA